MDHADALIFMSDTSEPDAPQLHETLKRQLARAGIELGRSELRGRARIAPGRTLILLLFRGEAAS